MGTYQRQSRKVLLIGLKDQIMHFPVGLSSALDTRLSPQSLMIMKQSHDKIFKAAAAAEAIGSCIGNSTNHNARTGVSAVAASKN